MIHRRINLPLFFHEAGALYWPDLFGIGLLCDVILHIIWHYLVFVRDPCGLAIFDGLFGGVHIFCFCFWGI